MAGVFPEVRAEAALVAKAEAERDFGEGFAGGAEGVAGGLDAAFHPVGSGGDAERLVEGALQVADGQVTGTGEALEGREAVEVRAEQAGGGGDSGVGGVLGSLALAGASDSENTDQVSGTIAEGELAGEVPIGKADFVDTDLESSENGFSGGDDGAIVLEVLERERARSEISVGF